MVCTHKSAHPPISLSSILLQQQYHQHRTHHLLGLLYHRYRLSHSDIILLQQPRYCRLLTVLRSPSFMMVT